MQQIAILIPVHNALKHTMISLSSLYALKYKHPQAERIKIIVIDDGSTDATVEWITNNYPQTTLLHGDGSLWWSGAINLGIYYALNELKSDYLLWWNNDIIPSDDYFTELLNIIDNKVTLIGGSKIYYAGTKDQVWSMGGIFDTRSGRKYMIGMNDQDNEKYESITEVDWLPGMGTFLHKSVFEKVGLIDESNFPQYHGDSDFTFRAKLAGFTIKVFPQLKIWNDKSNSGLLHQNNYKLLVRSLKDIKSNYHISKDLSFYRRYATSSLAYQTLAYKYCYYIGGFIKWKLLNTLGISKHRSL